MIRARFLILSDDYRPMVWPIKYPYWCSGYAYRGMDMLATIVAYVEDEATLKTLWPDAVELDIEEVDSIVFTTRFPRPVWYKD